MGYTGAFYQEFFGTSTGLLFSFGTLTLWVALPVWGAMRIFNRRDW
jgi:Cu-processing system permease protein